MGFKNQKNVVVTIFFLVLSSTNINIKLFREETKADKLAFNTNSTGKQD